jgi:hypothetical protein
MVAEYLTRQVLRPDGQFELTDLRSAVKGADPSVLVIESLDDFSHTIRVHLSICLACLRGFRS